MKRGQGPRLPSVQPSSSVYTAEMAARPMQEATFLVLTALAAGSQHGYGILSDVAEISGGRVRLRAGTLYAALDRLRIDGLVEVDREEVVDSRLRRYYRLTPRGSDVLAGEACPGPVQCCGSASPAAAAWSSWLAGWPDEPYRRAGGGVPALAALLSGLVPPRT